MSGSSRKFRRRRLGAVPGGEHHPGWPAVEARERAAYDEVLRFISAKMPGRGFALVTCPPSDSGDDVPVDAIGYGSNLGSYDTAIEIFYALEERWRALGMAVATVTAPVSRASSLEPAGPGGFRRRVQELWADFEARLLSDDFSDVQRQEMRRAFYGGAFSIVGAIASAASDDDEMTPGDEQIMVDLAAEREEYLVNLQLGRA